MEFVLLSRHNYLLYMIKNVPELIRIIFLFKKMKFLNNLHFLKCMFKFVLVYWSQKVLKQQITSL